MRLLTKTFTLTAALGLSVMIGAATAGAQAVATCKDGTTSMTSGRGACSSHGGVDAAKTAAMKASAKASAKESAKAAKANAKATAKATAKTVAPIAAPAPSPKPMARAEMSKPGSGEAAAKAGAAVKGSGGKEDNNPVGAIAKCKDGMYSHATHRQGACSGHGGVASWT